jgi:hypothetical protein
MAGHCSQINSQQRTVAVRLTQLAANWPWLVAYISVATVVFIWLRRSGSTDAQAGKVARDVSGFGAATTLGAISAQFFRLIGPRILLLVLIAACAVRLSLGSWNLWDAAVVLSVVAFWPLQEWLVHVFLLHLKPTTLFGRHFDPIVSRNHRNHHRNPWDPELGITPSHIIWMYTAGLPAIWSLALPLPQALTGVAIYFVLALNYEWVHYLIHTSYAPHSRLYRRLWLNHRLHHFKNEQYWYGVTMLSGDWLLLTRPKAQDANRSETCLTLGVGSEYGSPVEEDAAA